MHDDLGRRLKEALESDRRDRPPPVAGVLQRARRIRIVRRALAAVSVVVVSIALVGFAALTNPTDGTDPGPDDAAAESRNSDEDIEGVPRGNREPVIEDITEKDRAEIFAFRAMAATNLMGPFNARSFNFTYEEDTTRDGAIWRVGFASSDCEPRGSGNNLSFTCRGLSGENDLGNALTDTYVEVTLDDGEWTVVGVDGAITDEERERVVGYTLQDREEPSHWEFPAADTWPSEAEGGTMTELMALWVGPYPTSAPGSVCEVTPIDEHGDPVAEAEVFYEEPPDRAFEAAGWIRGSGVDAKAQDVEVECEQYSGPGWELDGEPEITVTRRSVFVSAELIWRGPTSFTAPASCTATLVDDKGEVVWEGSGRAESVWPPPKPDDERITTHALLRGGRTSEEPTEVDEFTCKTL